MRHKLVRKTVLTGLLSVFFNVVTVPTAAQQKQDNSNTVQGKSTRTLDSGPKSNTKSPSSPTSVATIGLRQAAQAAIGPIYTMGASYRIANNNPVIPIGPIYTMGASYRIARPVSATALGPIYNLGASYVITNAIVVPPTAISTTASGLVFSRVTQTYNGTVTLQNITNMSIAGPLRLAISSLTAGVTLTNATGVFNGSPYITVSGVSNLMPGQSVVVNVIFNDPSNVKITFTPVIYSGSF